MKLALIVLLATSAGVRTHAESAVSDAFSKCLDALSQAKPVIPPADFRPMADAERLAFALPPQTIDAAGTTVTIAPGLQAPDHGWVTDNLEIISWGADRSEQCSVNVASRVSEEDRNRLHLEALGLLSDQTRSGKYVDYPPAEIAGLIAEAILLNDLNPAARCVVAGVPDPQTAGSRLMFVGEQSDHVCPASRELFE